MSKAITFCTMLTMLTHSVFIQANDQGALAHIVGSVDSAYEIAPNFNTERDAPWMEPPPSQSTSENPPRYKPEWEQEYATSNPGWRPSTDFVETRNPLYTGNTAHETLDTSFGSVVFPPDPSDAESEASSDQHENHRDHRTESCRTRCWQSSACCKIKLVGAVVCATCLSLGIPSIIALATTS